MRRAGGGGRAGVGDRGERCKSEKKCAGGGAAREQGGGSRGWENAREGGE